MRSTIAITLLAAFVCYASQLREYRLTIDQVYLDVLYADPWSGSEYPGVIHTDGGSSTCLVRFRGKSSLAFPKKSWAVTMDDPNLLGRRRLNLNAEYMDPGMLRNAIALRTTELLGFPSSRTEHVRFHVNDEYQGVYLDVERVDDYLFERYGLDGVAVFKAYNELARFMPMVSGVHQSAAYRPRSESVLRFNLLMNLIGMINAGASPLPADEQMLMAYYAVSLGLFDRDSGSNNYYLVLGSDGTWRLFPWDRSSCLGGQGDGQFHPEHAYSPSLLYFKYNSLFESLIRNPDNAAMLSHYLHQVTHMLSDEIPFLIDSMYNAIRHDLYDDPMSPWTQEELDQALEDILWFCSERAQFLSENHPLPGSAVVTDMRIENPWLEPGEQTSVSITIEGFEYDIVSLRWYQGILLRFRLMTPSLEDEATVWETVFTMPSGQDFYPFDFYFRVTGAQEMTSLHPSYSLWMYHQGHQGLPHAVTPQPGAYPPSGSAGNDLTVLPPVVYGPEIWAIPVLNTAGHIIDVSCCVFSASDFPGRAFVPPGITVHPGDTVFITNSHLALTSQFPGRTVIGDLCMLAPPGGTLTMEDPGWNTLWTASIPAPEEHEPGHPGVTVTEICFSQPPEIRHGDWIELHNPSDTPVDAGGMRVESSEGRLSMIPWNTVMEPGSFLVLARRAALLEPILPPDCHVADLDFGLSSSGDVLTVRDRFGNLVQQVSWTSAQAATGHILGLIHPSLNPAASDSWEFYRTPGTPGEPNRLWNLGGEPLSILLLSPNPVRGESISFAVTSMSSPIEAFVYDVSGRVVAGGIPVCSLESSSTIPLPKGIPSGLYFLAVRTPVEFRAVKFTVL